LTCKEQHDLLKAHLKSFGPTQTHDAFSCLVELSSPGLKPDDAARMLANALPWAAVLKLAIYHGVVPLLYKNLKPFITRLPAGTGKELSRLYLLNARLMLLFTAEIHRIAKAFQAHGTPCVFFKGPVLASLLYGDITLRQSVDIDLLTFPQYYRQATQTMAGLGYAVNGESALSGRLKAWFPGLMRDLSLFQSQKRMMAELHFRLLPGYVLSIKQEKSIFHRFTELQFHGIKLLSLAPVELMFYLCLHGSIHQFERLIWLADLDRLMSQFDEAAFGALFLKAREMNLERPLIQALLLLEHFYHRPLPQWVGGYENRSVLEEFARLAGDRMIQGEAKSVDDGWARLRYLRSLREGGGYQLRCVGGWGLRQAFHAMFG
jgi:hypothetical protein